MFFVSAYSLYWLLLVGLVLWLLTSRTTILQLALGNSGWNVFWLLTLALLNSVFISFLTFKALTVNEIAQFVTYFSVRGGFTYWLRWRRSPLSATRFARVLHALLLTVLPFATSAAILFGTGVLLYSDPKKLVSQPLAPVAAQAEVNQASSAQLPASLIDFSEAFARARLFYLLIVLMHFVPVYLFYLNAVPIGQRWRVINQLRDEEFAIRDVSNDTDVVTESDPHSS